MDWTKWIDPAWLATRLTPMLTRYALVGIAFIAAKMGYDGEALASAVSPHVQLIVGALFAILVVLWGGAKKASVPAHEAAKTVEHATTAGIAVDIATKAGNVLKTIPAKNATST